MDILKKILAGPQLKKEEEEKPDTVRSYLTQQIQQHTDALEALQKRWQECHTRGELDLTAVEYTRRYSLHAPQMTREDD